MTSYIASLYRILFEIFAGSAGTPQFLNHKPRHNMIPYTCTVSVHAGRAPEDATAHHVYDKNGRLASFENPHPSAGTLLRSSLIHGLSVFLR